MVREFVNLAQPIAKTASVMMMAHAVKAAFWDTSETRARKIVNQRAMGRAMRTQLKRMMGNAQLAYMVSLAACVRRSATLRAKLVNSMGASSTPLMQMIALCAQRMNLQC